MDADLIAAYLESDPPVKEADLWHDLWVHAWLASSFLPFLAQFHHL